MGLTFDSAKCDKNPADRGLDYADAEIVFAGITVEVEDLRADYGETRIICYGLLEGRLVVVGYTPRGADRPIFSMRKANEREKARSPRSSKSDLARVDKHRIEAEEYEDLPEITDEMLDRAKINNGGRPVSPNPRKLISLRLPADVIERWRKTGPGWQTRMAERLSKVR